MNNLITKTTFTAIAIAIFAFNFTTISFAAAGDLDLSFSGDGFNLTQLGDGQDRVADSAIQTDGKIVVAGTSGIGANSQFALARYTTNGSLDTTFGFSGKMTTRNIAHLAARSVAIQSDGKILVGGAALSSGSNSVFVVARYNTNGFLDTAFGNVGLVTTAINNRDCIGGSIAILPSGNIVLAGSFGSTANQGFAVIQYKPDGSIASDFGNNGLVLTDITPGVDTASSVAIQSNGRIVVAGSTNNNMGSERDFAVVRYLANGNLDTSFGSGGIITTAIGPLILSVSDIKLQITGELLVVGSAGFPSRIAMVRYKSDGTLDTNFDSDGIVVVDDFNINSLGSASIQPDGKIIVAAETTTSNTDFLVTRFNSNGSLDTSFDSDGKVITSISGTDDSASSVVIQTDGKIVAAGTTFNSSSYDFAVVRYSANGSLDTTFNTDGITTTNNFSSKSQLNATALQPDGKIVAGGTSFEGGQDSFLVVRYNSNGSLDPSFSANGITSTLFGTGNSEAYSVAIQSDGKIVLAGDTFNGTNFEMAIARYNANGTLDLSFDTDGKVVTASGVVRSLKARSVGIQSDGKIVVAGNIRTGIGSQDFVVARFNTNGSPDTTFDTDGIASVSTATRAEIANSLVIQSDGKTVVVGTTSDDVTGAVTYFGVARFNTNGSLDTTFSGDGIDTGFIASEANSVKLDSDGKIVVAGKGGGNFVLARYNTNGSLDTSFDSDGIVTTNIGGIDSANSIAIQPDGKIIAAGSSLTINPTNFNFALVRYNSNGSLDASSFTENNSNLFGSGGIVTTNFNQISNDIIAGIVLQPDGKIVAVGSSDEQFAVARYQGLSPTAATAAINGRVSSASGRGIRNVSLTLTDTTTGEIKYSRTSTFGYYRFLDLEVGRSYVLSLSSKRFTFAEPTRVITLNEDLTNEDFVSEEK